MNLFKYFIPAILAGCLFLAAANAVAGPIVFTHSEYTVFASADLGANTEGPFTQTSPPAELPLLVDANLGDFNNSSSATGIANAGQFDVSTEAISLDAFAAAVAGAGFSGEFTGTGERVEFLIDFSNFNDVIDGMAGAQLFVTLLSDGISLFDEIFSSSQIVQQSFMLSAGTTNLFDIQLISSAEAEGSVAGTARGFNLASAAFGINAAPAPEPAMVWLMLVGMGLLALTRRKTGRAAIR